MPLRRQGKGNHNIGGAKLDCGGEMLFFWPLSRLKVSYIMCALTLRLENLARTVFWNLFFRSQGVKDADSKLLFGIIVMLSPPDVYATEGMAC